MRVGELARRTNRTVRALHLYEELGLLTPAERTASGYRMYDDGNVARIEYIGRLQQLGLSLSEIAETIAEWRQVDIPRDAMHGLHTLYEKRLAEVRHQIKELKVLETELIESLAYLDGCTGCTDTNAAEAACHSCIQTQPYSNVLFRRKATDRGLQIYQSLIVSDN